MSSKQLASKLRPVLSIRLPPCTCSHRRYSTPAYDLEDLYPELALKAPRSGRLEKIRARGTFVDKTVVKVEGGKGGDGAVAFHREKYVEKGPPSGGNGGQGGSVFIQTSPNVHSLGSIPHSVRGKPGTNGQGNWLHGRQGKDMIIEVPIGTIVRQLELQPHEVDENPLDPDEIKVPEPLQENHQELGLSIKSWKAKQREAAQLQEVQRLAIKTRRKKLFVHYPEAEDRYDDDSHFLKLEKNLVALQKREERDWQYQQVIDLDLDKPMKEPLLIVHGGSGGFGNPYFLSGNDRSPKYATRGRKGRVIKLELEVKILADIGLVGYPNAGKSTLLKALTNSKAQVASYAFTTLHPQIGTLIVYDDATFGDGSKEEILDSPSKSQMYVGHPLAGKGTKYRQLVKNRIETTRLKIADCPGLIPNASDNVGLGHDFLRHIERSTGLVYVVDLSGPMPWHDLGVLEKELEAYQTGLSRRTRLVVANKADLLGGTGAAADKAKQKLEKLKEHVQAMSDRIGTQMEVIPVSAMKRLNVGAVALKLAELVDTHRREEKLNA